MMSSPIKLALTVLFLTFPLCAVARAQSEEAPQQISDENRKADEAAFQKDWNEQCKSAFDRAKPVPGLHLLSGPNTGYYYKVGIAISKIVAGKASKNDGTPLEIQSISTEQTKCNLLGLETKNPETGKKYTEFALVQSDIAHDAWYGHPPVRLTQAQDITLVAPLYVEAVHIIIRPHLNLAHLSDLRGRRVFMGPKGSLTVLSAKRILDAAGLTEAQIAELEKAEVKPDTSIKACRKSNSPRLPISDLDPECALMELRRFDVDAVFQVGAVPFDTVHDAIVPSDTNGQLLDSERHKKPCDAIRAARLRDPSLIDSELHLFNLDVDLVQRLVADGSYIEQLIPADAYCQESATLTVGVRALLLTNRGESDPAVGRIASIINQYQSDIETNLRQQVELEQKTHGDAVTGVPATLALLRVPTPAPLAVRYHPEITADKIYFSPGRRFVTRELPILAAGLLVLVFVLYGGRRVLGPWFARRGELAVGLPLLVILWVATSWLLRYFEGSVNEDFSSLPTALLSTVENLVGFGNGPITQSGQQWWSRCRWLALAIFGTMLLPSLRQLWAKGWAIAKSRLLRLGHAPNPAPAPVPAPAPATDAPAHGATDHGLPSRPAPTH
jgi:TRAP transporter TAXI family solute receptor